MRRVSVWTETSKVSRSKVVPELIAEGTTVCAISTKRYSIRTIEMRRHY